MADSEFDAFLKRRDEAATAYVKGDPEPVDALTATKGSSTFFGPDGGYEQGAERVRQVFRQGAAHFGSESASRLEVLQSAAGEDLAFWSGFQHATVQMKDGKQVAMNLRITEIFRRQDGEWRLIHRHADMGGGKG